MKSKTKPKNTISDYGIDIEEKLTSMLSDESSDSNVFKNFMLYPLYNNRKSAEFKNLTLI